MTDPVPSKDFEPCYCAACDGMLPAPCRYGTGQPREQRPSKDQLRLWRQRVETYGGMQLTKPESLALFAEIERLSKPAHERESPHCSTCSCGMQPEPPGESRNVLPKITEEVVVLLWGSSLIESDYPGAPWSWSQCAVDFACLLNEGLAERRAAVTTEGGQS